VTEIIDQQTCHRSRSRNLYF